MKKRVRATVALAMVFCMNSTMISGHVFATQKQLDEVQNSIDTLENEREESRQTLEELKEDKTHLDERFRALDENLSVLAEELTRLEDEIAQKESEIVVIENDLEEANQEEERQYENMKKRIRFLYEKGNESMVQALLESDSLAEFMNRSEYVENIHRYDREMLQEYQLVVEMIQNKETQLKQDLDELQSLAQRQEEKKEEVEALLSEVETQIDATNQQISVAENEIAEYNRKLEEQKEYEAKLEAQKAAEEAKRLEEEKKREEIKKQEQENTKPPVISESKSDLAMLAALIECEAGGESYEGKLAVGSVIMNRVRSSYFPNSVVEVIYQRGQFTPVSSGRFAAVLSRGAKADCVQAAEENLSGRITVNCLYFRRNTGAIDGIVIGNHVFY